MKPPGATDHEHEERSPVEPMTGAADSPGLEPLDRLDIPFAQYTDVGFFAFGADRVTDEASPSAARSERLRAHPGLRPLSGLVDTLSSPLPSRRGHVAACRGEHTDAALREQLALEDEGHPATVGQGDAAVRFVNPTTGGEVMPTIRCEFHRLRDGASTAPRHEVGSSVRQVFEGAGTAVLGDAEHRLETGDLFVVPSWVPWSLHADSPIDLFRFSDAPIVERAGFARTLVPDPGAGRSV